MRRFRGVIQERGIQVVINIVRNSVDSGNTQAGGLVIYDVEEKKFDVLTDPPATSRWLSDSRLLFEVTGCLHVLASGQGPIEVRSSLPGFFVMGGISTDDRHFYGRIIKISADLRTINIEPSIVGAGIKPAPTEFVILLVGLSFSN